MRKAAPIGLLTMSLVGAASVALAAHSAPASRAASLSQAATRTARVSSQRYAFDVRITRSGKPVVMHVHGFSTGAAISVSVRMGDQKLPDGTVVPGPDGAALIDGPFLYERAPSFIVVLGNVHWLRVPIASAGSDALRSVHDLTPEPLLRLLGEANAKPTSSSATIFRGTIPYDDPIVTTALNGVTGGIQFRDLRVVATLGGDGLVHGIRISGHTADSSVLFRLDARLFAFGKPVSVTPPAEGTFIDKQLLSLQE